MLPTYRAVLHGDRLEWDDDVPADVRDRQTLSVFVTILAQSNDDDATQGRRMADALERLATAGGTPSIGDAADWQRDQREDRPLPGRVL